MSSKKQHQVSEIKKKVVKELLDLINKNNTVLVCSIKNIPASQFQEIKKSLRGKAIVKVPKKSLIYLAIEKSKDKELEKIKEKIQDSIAILFSDLDSFELASELLKRKTPAKAKPGQEAPEDIEIPEGPTDLVPGPAVSDLGALGIQIKIEKGKINIQKPKVIVKKGEKISDAAADIMAKLDIKPFKIGFEPLAAFDKKDKKVYLEIKINPEETLEKLKNAYSKALPFAIEINYICKDTIGFLLAKASVYAKHIKKFIDSSLKKPEKEKEDKKESEKDKNKSTEERSSIEKAETPGEKPEINNKEDNVSEKNNKNKFVEENVKNK